MIPSVESAVTALFGDKIADISELFPDYDGYTSCLHQEAKNWGTNVGGLNCLHQFDKVEPIELAHPDKCFREFEISRNDIEVLL
jgi:seryl-tRNA synthetase